MAKYWVDIFAVGFFILEWTVYAVTLEHTAYGRDSLSARMNGYREVWIRRMLDRDARMVDMQIMASLQNGTAFFASTSLIAVGGGLALLRATNEALAVLGALPIFLRAGLSGLVRQPLGSAGDDRVGGDRHMAQAVRFQCLARDGTLGTQGAACGEPIHTSLHDACLLTIRRKPFPWKIPSLKSSCAPAPAHSAHRRSRMRFRLRAIGTDC
jgi:hypothetical protein